MSGYLQAQLLRLTIGKLSDTGITVVAVTSDATAHSIQVAKALGIPIDGDKMKCTFQHPSGQQHTPWIFFLIILLLLTRNAFRNFKAFSLLMAQHIGSTLRSL